MDDRQPLIYTNKLDTTQNKGVFNRFILPCSAEFFGVCLFVFVGCMSVQTGQVVTIALAHGLTIALLINGLGDISGGHFNPAVTLGATIAGGTAPVVALLYFISQLLGGMLGAAFTRAVLPTDVYGNISAGGHALPNDVGPGWGILCELILTTVLVFTVLMNAIDNRTKNKLAPLAIGFAVAVDIMAGAKTSGASMNPARSFGPAVVGSSVTLAADLWEYHYVYWVGPALGGLVTGILYRLLFASSEQRWFGRGSERKIQHDI
ncbi:hypothetical protein ScPMuIL_004339 [Solemya velum]